MLTTIAGLAVLAMVHVRPDTTFLTPAAFDSAAFDLAAFDSIAFDPVGAEAASRVKVRFDFAGGLGGPIHANTGGLSLNESTMGGGELIQMPRGANWAVHFPGRCTIDPQKCPRAILESEPAEFLNPGTSRVRWGASVMMLANETSDGGNVLQKGLSVSGTQFKLQIDGPEGRPSCVVGGGSGRYVALSRVGIADGRWHDLACERNKSQLTLVVDGSVMAVVPLPAALSLTNDEPLRLGGKGHGPYNDQFHGTLDDAFVEIG